MPAGSNTNRRTDAFAGEPGRGQRREPNRRALRSGELRRVTPFAGQRGQRDRDLDGYRAATQRRQLAGSDSRVDDLSEPVGPPLLGPTFVVRTGGNQEGCERAGQSPRSFGVEHPCHRVHSVEQGGDREPTTREVFFGLLDRPVGINDLAQVASGSP